MARHGSSPTGTSVPPCLLQHNPSPHSKSLSDEEDLKLFGKCNTVILSSKWSEVKVTQHVQLCVTAWKRPWNSPGQNTGVNSCSLLQGIFPTQRSNPGLPHCRCILYQLSHQENLRVKVEQLKQMISSYISFKPERHETENSNKHTGFYLSTLEFLCMS